jgi:antitoxin Phd
MVLKSLQFNSLFPDTPDLDRSPCASYNLDRLDRRSLDMKRAWQIQEAKNKLSEVVEEALHHGPQIITKRGVEVAVMLSYAEYRKMTSSRKKISHFFRESPLVGADLDLSRDKGGTREDVCL